MKLNHNGKVLIMVIQDELEGIEKINYIFSEIQKIPEIKEFIKHNKKSLFNRVFFELVSDREIQYDIHLFDYDA